MVEVVQVAYKRMGFKMMPPEHIVRRALEGIILGQAEVNVGGVETIGGWASQLFPRVADLYWRLFMPSDFPEIAAGQKTE